MAQAKREYLNFESQKHSDNPLIDRVTSYSICKSCDVSTGDGSGKYHVCVSVCTKLCKCDIEVLKCYCIQGG